MEQAINASQEMLKNDWEMFNEAVKTLRKNNTSEMAINIEEKDNLINKYEREVRKKVLTHLAISGVNDLNIGLVLINIVTNIERIGDYTKNIIELAQNHPGRLVIENFEPNIKDMEETISKNFGNLIQALEQADNKLAKELLDELWQIKNKCDSYNESLLKDNSIEIQVNDAVAIALYMRYLKRIASHLMNVATSLVNPYHKIGYRNE